MNDERYYIFTADDEGMFYDPTPFGNKDDAWDEAVRRSTKDGLNRWVQAM